MQLYEDRNLYKTRIKMCTLLTFLPLERYHHRHRQHPDLHVKLTRYTHVQTSHAYLEV